MRHLQPWLVNYVVTEEDEVEVEGPGGAWIGAFAAEVPLDREQLVEQGTRIEGGRAGHDRIEEERLVAEDFPIGSLRFGFDDGRKGDVGKKTGQASLGKGHRGLPVPEVAAERDRDRPVRRCYCSIHRTGSTPPPVPASCGRLPRRSVRPAAACSKNRLCSSVSPTITLSIVR